VLNGVAVWEGVRLGVTGVGEKIDVLVQLGMGVTDGSAVQLGEGLGVSVGCADRRSSSVQQQPAAITGQRRQDDHDEDNT